MALPPALHNRLRLPVVGSPLFIISNPDLVIAQCKAGIVGSFPALNARPEPVLEEWLERITSELADYDKANPDAPSAPFAVNQIVHGSNARLKHDMDMCVKYEVPMSSRHWALKSGSTRWSTVTAASSYTTSSIIGLQKKRSKKARTGSLPSQREPADTQALPPPWH